MWTYTKIDWVSTDFFEYEDYNRIKKNIEYLIEFAFTLYERWEHPEISKLKIESLYFANILNVIEKNLELMAENTFRASDFESTKEFSENNVMWNHEDINRIERSTLLYFNILNSQSINKKFLAFKLGGDFYG